MAKRTRVLRHVCLWALFILLMAVLPFAVKGLWLIVAYIVVLGLLLSIGPFQIWRLRKHPKQLLERLEVQPFVGPLGIKRHKKHAYAELHFLLGQDLYDSSIQQWGPKKLKKQFEVELEKPIYDDLEFLTAETIESSGLLKRLGFEEKKTWVNPITTIAILSQSYYSYKNDPKEKHPFKKLCRKLKQVKWPRSYVYDLTIKRE
ncbi:hypothetical protein [Alicyclobacillus fodiniaquatilis]|uniref:Uncharacterized protein n=1 Tax=Alicyclobacillus fodiniaquatilis TaxID=1661150 RepID=A0ABW4JHK7_9BACL